MAGFDALHLEHDGDFLRVVCIEEGARFVVPEVDADVHTNSLKQFSLVTRQDSEDDRHRFIMSVREAEQLWTFLGKHLNKIN